MNGKTVGEYISDLRKKAGLTQREMAKKLNVSDKTVSRWECDENLPDIYMALDIAKMFGITVDELLRCGEKIESLKTVSSETEKDRAEKRRQDTDRDNNIERVLRVKSVDYNMRSNVVRVVPFFAFVIAAAICHGLGAPGINEWVVAISAALIIDVSAVIYQIYNAVKFFANTADRCVNASKRLSETVQTVRKKLVKKAMVSVGTVVVLFVLTVVYLHLGDIVEFLLCGIIFAPIAIIVCFIVALFVWDAIEKRGKFTPM